MATSVFLFGERSVCDGVLASSFSASDGFQIVGATSRESDVITAIDSLRVRILGLYVDGSDASFRVAQQVYAIRPDVITIAIVKAGLSDDQMAQLLSCGLAASFVENTPHAEIINGIRHVVSVETSRLEALASSSIIANTKYLAFLEAKGGVGTSTLVANLAIDLVREGNKVLVVDLDLQYGDVGVFFGVKTRMNIGELLQEHTSPTIDDVRQYLTIHDSGVNILTSPANPEIAEKINSSQVDRLLATVRGHYDYVLIDTNPYFDDMKVTICEQSSLIFVCTKPDISVLRHTRRMCSLLYSFNQAEKVRFVVTFFDAKGRIKVSDVEKVFGAKVWGVVPFDFQTTTDAINRGVPASFSAPKSDIAQAVSGLAQQLSQQDPSARQAEGQAKHSRYVQPNTDKPHRGLFNLSFKKK